MFYKPFSAIMEIFNPTFVKDFDYWLATLPQHKRKNITASLVAAKFGVRYAQAEEMLKYANTQGILEKYYIVTCPYCDDVLAEADQSQLAEILITPQYCEECEEERVISTKDICLAYKVIKKPDISDAVLEEEIERRIHNLNGEHLNFQKADSLENRPEELYLAFYNPDESAYQTLHEMRNRLDNNYENTKAKGDALEHLVEKLFTEIKGVQVSTNIKSATNQFDCTCMTNLKFGVHTVYDYLCPYFIIECKNEKKKPDTTYFNKLIGILDTNAAKLGIIFARLESTRTCSILSREHYLKSMGTNKPTVIITFSDKDLSLILDDRVNLLDYLNFKILQVTAGAQDADYKSFTM